MNTIQKLIQEVSTARTLYLDKVAKVSEVQARWKPDAEVWNIIEITEHLFWAAQPHPISGAVDFQQRLEFIRFHIIRHEDQVAQLLKTMTC